MMKKTNLLVMLFVTFCLFSIPVSATIDLRPKIYLSEDNLDAGDSFTLTIQFENEDNRDFTTSDDLEISVYIDDVLVHEDEISPSILEGEFYNYTVGSNNFEVDNDRIFRDNLMDYECGNDKVIRVDISGDADDADDDDEFDVDGDDLSVDIDPETPTLDSKITVTVTDEDNDELRNADVKFTFLEGDEEWDADDKDWSDDTDSNGEVEVTLDKPFRDNDYGVYQLDVYKNNYCKYTTEIEVKNELNIAGPIPETPTAGQSFTLTATDGAGKVVRGLLAYASPGNYRATTNSNGIASFRIDESGTYTIHIGGGSYPEQIVTVTIADKAALDISIEPAQPKLGETVTVKITSGGTNVASASVSITVPGGTYKTLSTSSAGIVTYIPTVAGIYSIDASKRDYSTSTATFTAQSAFEVIIPSLSNKKVGDRITVVVLDNSGNPVVAATVRLDDGSSGTTDTKGEYTFTIPSAGEHIITISKNGFVTKKQDFSLTGKLIAKLSETSFELGGTLTVDTLDRAGSKIEGVNIVITKPDGTKQAVSTTSYTPTVSGNHTVTVSKTGYADVTESFEVKPKQLDIDMDFEGDTLTLTVTSRGKPVKNLTVSVDTPKGIKEAITDNAGRIMMSAKAKGDYTARAISDEYDTRAMTYEKGGLGFSILWIVIIIVVLIVLVVIVAVAYHVYNKKGGSTMMKPGKSSLHK